MKTYIAFFMLLFALGLAGCNTMEGLGEDIESAGDAIEDEASESTDDEAAAD